jgi:DNA-binding SARP family transcriptional activator
MACLDRLDAADAEARKRVLRAVRDGAEEPQGPFEDFVDPVSTFLTDRLAFCRRQRATEQSVDAPEGAGTIESIRN